MQPNHHICDVELHQSQKKKKWLTSSLIEWRWATSTIGRVYSTTVITVFSDRRSTHAFPKSREQEKLFWRFCFSFSPGPRKAHQVHVHVWSKTGVNAIMNWSKISRCLVPVPHGNFKQLLPGIGWNQGDMWCQQLQALLLPVVADHNWPWKSSSGTGRTGASKDLTWTCWSTPVVDWSISVCIGASRSSLVLAGTAPHARARVTSAAATHVQRHAKSDPQSIDQSEEVVFEAALSIPVSRV